MLRIRPTAGIELDRVTVTIHAELKGMLESSIAVRDPISGDWHYMRKTNHPVREGARVEITAIPAGGLPRTLLILEHGPKQLSVMIRCGEEVRRLVLSEGNPP